MNELQKGDRVQYVAGNYIAQKFGRVVDVIPGEPVEYVVKWDNEGTVDTITFPSFFLRKVD